MKLVIIGNGVAGVTTARWVAERDSSVDITIYSEDAYLYYLRPRLMDVVAGRVAPEEMSVYPATWYEKRGIRMVLNCRVKALNPAEHQVTLDEGGVVQYDRLVLATGAHPWIPPIPGTKLEGVYVLRTMRDALSLRNKAPTLKHAMVLGGGLLGVDAALALSAHAIGVTMVELEPRLLPLQLDAEGAQLFRRLIEAEGIEVVTGDSCVGIEGQGHVERALLRSGRVLETNMVVVSVGVRSNVELAQSAGLDCHRGVLVDERMLTSSPDIYAVGDVAEFNHRIWGIIPAALAQARIAAGQIVGAADMRYQDIVPTTMVKAAHMDLMSMGEVNPKGEGFRELRRTDAVAGSYKKLTLRDGRVVGAIVIGDKVSVPAITQLITRQVDVSDHMHALLSDGFDLNSLIR